MTHPSTESEVLRLAQDLIALESHCDAGDREANIGRFLVSWFEGAGIESALQYVAGCRANVVARMPGGDGPSLMFNGHMDTVPAGDMRDAFTPTVRDGVLWGRGACDMKGAIAGMACAMATLARSDEASRLTGDLLFTGTIGEETGSIGVKALIEAGIRTDYAVVGEPTSMRIGIAHKGACFIRICLSGRAAHGSCPEQGVNAVSYAAQIIRNLENELRLTLALRMHPLLGCSTVSVGRIAGGTQPNIVAQSCFIDIDRRTLPSEADVLDEVRHLVSEVCNQVDGLSWHVEEMPETSLVPHVALGTSADAILVKTALQTCERLDLPGDPIGVTYWTDGGHLASSGIETIILGPGDIANAHGPADRVATRELAMCMQIYGDLARRLLLAS
ncbi:MAG: M20 family peptidase [Candidatus Atribacteria bacterium]|nr:MAG: M20 family peptidase [Candidatus Atribacteria bacterium]